MRLIKITEKEELLNTNAEVECRKPHGHSPQAVAR